MAKVVPLYWLPVNSRFVIVENGKYVIASDRVLMLTRKGDCFAKAIECLTQIEKTLTIYRQVVDVSKQYDEKGLLLAPWVIKE